MRVLKTIGELRDYRGGLKGSVGLVPTMGFLHEGHLSLVRRSIIECDHTVVSIFVNPTQFGPAEDFNNYPRDTERDLGLLESAGANAVFLPGVEEMYAPGADTLVLPGRIADRLEGAVRPGHFKGVATVVLKLFNLAQPHRAYFGQKDAQQVAVIRKMVADLNVPVEVVVMPTVREADGLAMSSRNSYLTTEERQAATVLYRSLRLAEDLIAAGERDPVIVRQRMIDLINTEPLASIDYVSVADASSLEELTFVAKPALISLAVRIGRTRLIDNIILS
ncbi:pantoate--beta-alanine ligase [Dehalogenimonas sp. THU2]|uniref:pantoate--beta-alanine ligase n=1 Tax=Dehalogenimonas sp. THU2 TaxID=3151121 RepID=UPI00321832AD